MWLKLQIGLLLPSFRLLFAGDRFFLPLLFYTGIACMGMFALAVGWEAIMTKQIVLGRRRTGNGGHTQALRRFFKAFSSTCLACS